jgi:hypothetical protein
MIELKENGTIMTSGMTLDILDLWEWSLND